MIFGGLLAGVVINVVEFFLNGVVLAKDWQAAMAALGRPPIAGSQIAVFFVWSFIPWGFLIGIFAVYMRPFVRATALDRRPRCASDPSGGALAIYRLRSHLFS